MMTTTLRPSSAETSTPDGGRSRDFAVCVNGRPVGGLQLSGGREPGLRAGRISGLTIRQGERGRGRGTVAALAAEEVLRSWGCVRVDAELVEDSDTPSALRFAGALGYQVRSRNMAKTLPAEPPALPEGVRPRVIDDEEYPTWLARASAGHVESLIGAGLREEDARARSESDHRTLLPAGPHTPGTVLRWLEADGVRVGALWVALIWAQHPDGRDLAWVFDVEVLPDHRGRGHGRSLMLLAERECLAAGVGHLGLNVFADNVPANALYRSLGYETYRTTVFKYL
ncbi:GNAT superfamily N-acetyltransferase [Streptacidiphilus sp. MAP12-16]|uniref:GNAT family N-acetyltransferase n=1 Tax=Streptacidiphilus sp. MAP12-16 TaxID=3156300 RepID=UPI003517A965